MSTTDWATVASRVREGRMYLCFEEPDQPYGYAEIDNAGLKRDKGWAQWCVEQHPGLGCGWFDFVASVEGVEPQ